MIRVCSTGGSSSGATAAGSAALHSPGCSDAKAFWPKTPPRRLAVRTPHFRPRARRVVQLFMSGAASQCDTFDYKPELIKQHGTKFDPGGPVELFQSSAENCMKSP